MVTGPAIQYEMVATGYLPMGTVIARNLLLLTVIMQPERCLLIEDHLRLTSISPGDQVRDRIHHHLLDEVVVLVQVHPGVLTQVLVERVKER